MKKFYKENRVFVILMGIALVCIALIIAMMAVYVLKSTKGDKYGNRLDGIEDVEIDATKNNEMHDKILEMKNVEDVTINVHGKIVYFNVDFKDEGSVEDAKNVGIATLGFFEEDYLNYYDFQYIMTKMKATESSETFPFMGSRKAGSTTLTWSNNVK